MLARVLAMAACEVVGSKRDKLDRRRSTKCKIPLHRPDQTRQDRTDQTKSADFVGDRSLPGSPTKSGRARLVEFGCK